MADLDPSEPGLRRELVEGWKHFFRDDCRAPEFEGLTVEAATTRAGDDGVQRTRVIEADAEVAITLDFVPARLNLLVKDGFVVLAGWF